MLTQSVIIEGYAAEVLLRGNIAEGRLHVPKPLGPKGEVAEDFRTRLPAFGDETLLPAFGRTLRPPDEPQDAYRWRVAVCPSDNLCVNHLTT